MNRFTQFLILTILFIGKTMGQVNELPKVIQPSPVAQSFTIFGDYPVDYKTGIPSIDISLFDIKSGGMEVPITLRYHVGNAKPGIDRSNVGFGWIVDVGGIITRTVNNRKDESCPKVAKWDLMKLSDMCNEENFMYLFDLNAPEGEADAEYDEFSYAFNNNYGKFLIDRQSDNKFKVFDYPIQPFKYSIIQAKVQNTTQENPLGDIETISITDDNGNIYEFGGGNYESCGSVGSGNVVLGDNTGWYLKKITSPEGKVISFLYTDTYQIIDLMDISPIEAVDKPETTGVSDIYNRINSCTGPYQEFDAYIKEGIPAFPGLGYKMKILKEIDFPEGKVVFDVATNNKPQNSLQEGGNQYYTGICVYDSNLKIIRKIQFNQQVAGFYLQLNAMNIQDAVSGSNIESYNFNYNSPLCGSKLETDNWGYCNRVSGSSGPCSRSFVFKVPTIIPRTSEVVTFPCPDNSSNYKVNENYLKAQVLNKITYPTKGYTLFDWESNIYKGNLKYEGDTICKGNGLRIKKITDFSAENTTLKVKEYNYSIGHVANSPYNINNVRNIFSWVKVDMGKNEMGYYNYHITTRGRSFSNSLPGSLFENVYYDQVIEYDGSINNNGSKTYTYSYENANVYNPGSDYKWLLGNWTSETAPFLQKRGLSNGLLKQIDWKDNNNQLQKCEKYNYHFFENLIFKNLCVKKYGYYSDLYSPGMVLLPNDQIDIINYWGTEQNPVPPPPYIFYETSIPIGGYRMTGKTVSDFIGGQEVKVTTNYCFDKGYNNYPTKVETDLGYKKVVQEYKYPYDYTNSPYTNMTTLNIIKPVIEVKESIVKDNLTTLTSTNITDYKQWSTNVFRPEFVKQSYGNLTPENKIQFYGYDNSGNILDVGKANDMHTCYLWSYNYQYPVAKIEGITYNDLTQKYYSQSLVDQLAKTALPSISQIDAIRNAMINVPNAMITTYTYSPLVGMTSMTDPRGVSTYYEYDGLGRLKYTKDKDGKILQYYDYHYKQ